jgi:hypothetical protein
MQQHPVIRTQFFTWSALAKASFTGAMSFLRRPLLALRIAADSLKIPNATKRKYKQAKDAILPGVFVSGRGFAAPPPFTKNQMLR